MCDDDIPWFRCIWKGWWMTPTISIGSLRPYFIGKPTITITIMISSRTNCRTSWSTPPLSLVVFFPMFSVLEISFSFGGKNTLGDRWPLQGLIFVGANPWTLGKDKANLGEQCKKHMGLFRVYRRWNTTYLWREYIISTNHCKDPY